MTTEDQIVQWLSRDDELLSLAKEIVAGTPIPPDGEIFEYGDHELAEWVHSVLFEGDSGEFAFEALEIDLRYLNGIREELTGDEVLEADWELIRKILLGEE